MGREHTSHARQGWPHMRSSLESEACPLSNLDKGGLLASAPVASMWSASWSALIPVAHRSALFWEPRKRKESPELGSSR